MYEELGFMQNQDIAVCTPKYWTGENSEVFCVKNNYNVLLY